VLSAIPLRPLLALAHQMTSEASSIAKDVAKKEAKVSWLVVGVGAGAAVLTAYAAYRWQQKRDEKLASTRQSPEAPSQSKVAATPSQAKVVAAPKVGSIQDQKTAAMGGAAKAWAPDFSLDLVKDIERRMRARYNPIYLDVENQGSCDAMKVAIVMVSAAFEGQTRINRQRDVQSILKPDLDNGRLHALSCKLNTPAEYAQVAQEGQLSDAKAAPAAAAKTAASTTSTAPPKKQKEKPTAAASSTEAKSKPQEAAKEKGSATLFVKSRSPNMTQDEIKKLFQPFGTVVRIEIPTKDDNKWRGFAFVTLSNIAEASKAVSTMDKRVVDGHPLMVQFEDKTKTKGAEKSEKGQKGASDSGKGKGKTKRAPPQAQPSLSEALAVDPYSAHYDYYNQYYQQMYGQMYSAPYAHGANYGQEYEGYLKSIAHKKGYAFIDWPQNNLQKWFCVTDKDGNPTGKPRDVFISVDLLPAGGREIGAQLKFTIQVNDKGHPQARTCRLA
jgi:stress-induced morphogen